MNSNKGHQPPPQQDRTPPVEVPTEPITEINQPVENEKTTEAANDDNLPATASEAEVPEGETEVIVPPMDVKDKYRTWTTADGKFSREAEFQKAIADTVYLKKRDGSIIEVKKSQLSEEDMEWLKERARQSQ